MKLEHDTKSVLKIRVLIGKVVFFSVLGFCKLNDSARVFAGFYYHV